MKHKHVLVIDDNVTNLKLIEKTLKSYCKESFEHEVALKIIIDGKGKMFYPNIVDVFEKIHYKFQVANEIL